MGASVLIIDAEEDFANSLAETLRASGIEVQITPDGKAGLDAARINIPDTIVLCVELPRMSGYSICAKLKKDPTLKTVPLIITSAEATQETFEHHKKLKTRAEEYLKKPFNPQELLTLVNGFLGLPGDAGTPAEAEGDLPEVLIADEIAVDEVPMTLSDQEAFGLDGPFDGLQPMSSAVAPPPLPQQGGAAFDLGGGAGFMDGVELDDIEDDEARTMVGTMPIMAQVQDLEAVIVQLRKDVSDAQAQTSIAESARDQAMERVSSLPVGASQIPTAASGREVLTLKKELSKKEHEILELKDDLQQKGKELLSARDEHMELEDQLLQAQETNEVAVAQHTELEGYLASTRTQLEQAQSQGQEAEGQLNSLRAEFATHKSETEAAAQQIQATLEDVQARLTDESTRREALQVQLTTQSELGAELELSLNSRTSDLEAVSSEVKDKAIEIESLMGQTRGLGSELTRLGNELSASTAESDSLRGQLAATQTDVKDAESKLAVLQAEYDEGAAALSQTRERLTDAERELEAAALRDVRGHEVRAKARQALQIAAALLNDPSDEASSDDLPMEEPDFELEPLSVEDEAVL